MRRGEYSDAKRLLWGGGGATRGLTAVATTALAAAALAGCGTPQVAPTPGSAHNAPTATPPKGGPPVLVTPAEDKGRPPGKPTKVGALVLRLPKGWHAHSGPGKDSDYVSTNGCDKASLGCPGFRVMGAAQIKNGNRGKPYRSGSPFYPAQGAEPCPANPKLVQKLPPAPKSSGYGLIGDHKAIYHQWTISCVTKGKKPKVKSIFYQWEWYLPESKMLVVDQWSTTTLGKILKWAKFS